MRVIKDKWNIEESLCLLTLRSSSSMYAVCVCVCPVTVLVAEVLNNDRNSSYLLTPAAPITGEGNTMVSMATPPSASLPALPLSSPPFPSTHPPTFTPPPPPLQIRKVHPTQGTNTHSVNYQLLVFIVFCSHWLIILSFLFPLIFKWTQVCWFMLNYSC